MKNDEKAGNFSLAMADLESAQNTREKTYWTRHIFCGNGACLIWKEPKRFKNRDTLPMLLSC